MLQRKLLSGLAVCLSFSAFAPAQQAYSFNSDWRLKVGDVAGAEGVAVDDAGWTPVTLPRAFNEDDAFRVSIDKLSTGIAWYRKSFTLPADAVGKKVFLEFQGVRQAAQVFVNGKPAVLSENGVMAFGADVTGAVKAGDNVVAVRCDSGWGYREKSTNAPFQWNDKNFYANYGGINKNVLLHVKDKLYQTLPLFSNLGTTGVYVYAKDINIAARSAEVVAESQVKNEHASAERVEYAVTVLDREGKEVARFSAAPVEVKPGEMTTLTASQKLTGLNFWSWGYGYLYTVRTELKVDGQVVDRVDTRTGFRKTEFANGALKLNDRTIQMHGYAQRSTNEWPALGNDVPPWVSDLSNGMMVASNANLVRWMHVTPSKQDIESCDRVGLIQAMPAGDAEGDPTGRRWDLRVELMRDAIIYNRNNPSIIFYESGNKGIRDEHMDQMLAVKTQYDPHGGRAIGSREMMGSKTAEWGGEMLYINKSAAKPMWATEYLRDEGLRSWVDEFTPPYHKNGDGPSYKGDSGMSWSRNQDSLVAVSVGAWYDYWRERPGTGRRVNGGGVKIVFSDSNTHHRGTQNYRTSGVTDAMRLPKDTFYAQQVMWNGWVDVEKTGIFIPGHWNYAAGTTKDIQVVSSADKVELLLNGKSLGVGQQTDRFLFTFPKVAYAPGTLTAVGFDASGKKIAETSRKTVGEPAAIKLTPHTNPAGFMADGADLALVDVEVVDASGERCPTAFNKIDFKLDGPAVWRGGIAVGDGNYILQQSLPVELGINRVIVRSTRSAGTIRLSASSDKLKSAEITLQTKAMPLTGGLSPKLPGSELQSPLTRGPTPTGDSLRPTRVPLDIAKITAGSAQDEAIETADDDETTAWTSQGGVKNAWIKYELAKPATLSEVTMKLSAWRTKSYPIEILVDDKIVFKGNTPQSLGYVTLPVKPTNGRVVTIRLTGAASEKDQYKDIVEITGQKQAEGTTGPGGAKGGLSLVEVELYAPIVPAAQ
ncbi:MAG: DUF4982 domain-containing protein [Tepidisphaeraceae bacterium]